MRLKPIIVGLASNIKPIRRFIWRNTGGSVSARYCYSVWLRHLCLLHSRGKPTRFSRVAELGPGDSLGMGLMAMLTATDHFVGLDIVEYADTGRNLQTLDELVNLLRARADIPDAQEFPGIVPELESYKFPGDILSDHLLEQTLAPERLDRIRAGLRSGVLRDHDLSLCYVVPWYDDSVVESDSVSLAFSQAVLEHVDDLEQTYKSLAHWLTADGVMSHTIGLTDHGLTSAWNGHYAIPELLWKIIRGRRAYLINRQPLSAHITLMEKHGFTPTYVQPRFRTDGLSREAFAPIFRDMSDEDAKTEAALVQAVRKC